MLLSFVLITHIIVALKHYDVQPLVLAFLKRCILVALITSLRPRHHVLHSSGVAPANDISGLGWHDLRVLRLVLVTGLLRYLLVTVLVIRIVNVIIVEACS